VLFRTLCGGHWRFCVVTAFLFVVYIYRRRGLVPGLLVGHPRILASDFTQTDGGHRPLLTWDRQSLTPLWTAVLIYGLGLLVLARVSW